MELDELKAAWRAVDSRIEAGHALNARIFREQKLERTRSALRPLWWLLGTELAIALGATVLLGGFLADHWHLARFAVPAIVLDVVAVLTIGSAAAQLRLLSSLDYAQPVVAIQSVLTELALRRVREVRWQWLLMLPLWTPFAIVVAQGIFRVRPLSLVRRGLGCCQRRLRDRVHSSDGVAGATPGRGSRRDCGRAARRHRGSPDGGCHGTTR